MPQRRNAIKDLRQNRARHLRNLDIKTDLKKTARSFVATAKTDPNKAKEILKALYKKIDKAAKRHLLHKNTASRRKSRFAKLLLSK